AVSAACTAPAVSLAFEPPAGAAAATCCLLAPSASLLAAMFEAGVSPGAVMLTAAATSLFITVAFGVSVVCGITAATMAAGSVISAGGSTSPSAATGASPAAMSMVCETPWDNGICGSALSVVVFCARTTCCAMVALTAGVLFAALTTLDGKAPLPCRLPLPWAAVMVCNTA